MHVQIRCIGRADTIVVIESKLTKIEKLRLILQDTFNVAPNQQRLFYGGKLLEDGYTLHDYNIKMNNVIQLLPKRRRDSDIIDEADKTTGAKESDNTDREETDSHCIAEKEPVYRDAECTLYAVGDLVDMKHREIGAWFQGEIVAIVYDTNVPTTSGCVGQIDNNTSKENPAVPIEELGKNLLYKVKTLGESFSEEFYCKVDEIRPMARTKLNASDLKEGDLVMLNYNLDDNLLDKGYWHDFQISGIKKSNKFYELTGHIDGINSSTINDLTVIVRDDVYKIEAPVVPVAQRTPEYKKMMITRPPIRSLPLFCPSCRDKDDIPCKKCSCYKCGDKKSPEQTILCDECDKGFHIFCLSPPLTAVPDEDWYCPDCKRDNTDIIAPGAARQAKKATTTTRDWGRGMACVGKTKTSAMPANHFGPIPGIEVGMTWLFRIQLSETGVHRPPVSGIHGRDAEGAYSIVLSGGYEDDYDNGFEFSYTGSGGRDLSGNKRTAMQSRDQTLTRENRALARNCAVKTIGSEGADAGDNWKSGKPVRVVRSAKMLQHFPEFAPQAGIRYDGIYKVVKYYPEVGRSGYRVWKYLLRRDDPSPAPWESNAKKYPIIYPDGYLEAEATKKKTLTAKTKKASEGKASAKAATKSKEVQPIKNTRKRVLSDAINLPSSPAKKQINSLSNFIKHDIPDSCISPMAACDSENAENNPERTPHSPLIKDVLPLIDADTKNAKIWKECLDTCMESDTNDFISRVTQMFVCIICHEMAVHPTTTPCLHNFCAVCLTQALKLAAACPACRQPLTDHEPQVNDSLQAALRHILPGYDAGKQQLHMPKKPKLSRV